MKLYGQRTSGNCWKVRLALGFSQQKYSYQSLDTVQGETKEDWFLSINPAGKIPCLVLESGETVIESGAIVWRLLQGTPWWPQDLAEQTRVLSWMFWEQYSHEPALAVARSWRVYHGKDLEDPEGFAELIEKSKTALGLMEMQLTYSDWMATDRPTLADLVLFPYTDMVGDAGLELDGFPAVQAWLARFKTLEQFVPIEAAT